LEGARYYKSNEPEPVIERIDCREFPAAGLILSALKLASAVVQTALMRGQGFEELGLRYT
jgi:hypothetical protein